MLTMLDCSPTNEAKATEVLYWFAEVEHVDPRLHLVLACARHDVCLQQLLLRVITKQQLPAKLNQLENQAYKLGLVGKDLLHHMQNMRALRNHVSHRATRLDWHAPEHWTRVQKLYELTEAVVLPNGEPVADPEVDLERSIHTMAVAGVLALEITPDDWTAPRSFETLQAWSQGR
jgi:hypothetical protein